MPAPRRETHLGAFSPADATERPPVPEGPPARTVSDVIASVKKVLANEPSLSNVWVRGEISNLTQHSSGHWYFGLKDSQAVLDAVMFRLSAARVKFRPEEGMEVLARGRIDAYAARSKLQLIVDELRPVGAGELAIRFEQLKQKLAAEGLFAQARKRQLPPFPRTLGIVTSLQAAALRDMVRVATTRHPGIRLMVASARVQGEGAADEIAAAIRRLNAQQGIDVLIVGRGGGSVEDLWAFNEETVVRAVATSKIPVVSAVGHETDFTLCDLAADVRAATPSNACEIVVQDAEALHQALDDGEDRMAAALERLVPDLRSRVSDLARRSKDAVRGALRRERELLGARAGRLDALSPLAVLERGYAVVRKDGVALRSVDDASVGDDITITATDGDIDARVTAKRRKTDG